MIDNGGNLPSEFVLLRSNQVIKENREIYDALSDYAEQAKGKIEHDGGYIKILVPLLAERNLDLETAIFSIMGEVSDIGARLAIKAYRIHQRTQDGEVLSEEDITQIGQQVYLDYFFVANNARYPKAL